MFLPNIMLKVDSWWWKVFHGLSHLLLSIKQSKKSIPKMQKDCPAPQAQNILPGRRWASEARSEEERGGNRWIQHAETDVERRNLSAGLYLRCKSGCLPHSSSAPSLQTGGTFPPGGRVSGFAAKCKEAGKDFSFPAWVISSYAARCTIRLPGRSRSTGCGS